ncbi:hypothetical protein DL93DRAFT_2165482 [Clavulina sp. PMI_390]|nr:hypothetical protein DL93DRAFT_2165482 [Clavulina sp. PMI_390]
MSAKLSYASSANPFAIFGPATTDAKTSFALLNELFAPSPASKAKKHATRTLRLSKKTSSSSVSSARSTSSSSDDSASDSDEDDVAPPPYSEFSLVSQPRKAPSPPKSLSPLQMLMAAPPPLTIFARFESIASSMKRIRAPSPA